MSVMLYPCMLYPCMLSVALLMCLFVLCVACLTVFVNCFTKQFTMCLGVVAILLLNVMDVFSVCGGTLLDRPCMVFQRVCVVPVLSIGVYVLLPYVLFVFLYVRSYLLI